MDIKHVWVKKIRQLIQDTYFGTVSKVGASLPSLVVPSTVSTATSQRSSRDFDTESIEVSNERRGLQSCGSKTPTIFPAEAGTLAEGLRYTMCLVREYERT